MSDILNLLFPLFVVVAPIAMFVVPIVMKIKSLGETHSDVKGVPVGEEVFPKVIVYNENKVNAPASKKHGTTSKSKKSVIMEKNHRITYDAHSTVPEQKSENKEKLSLKSRSEAKRAFIYAELLKRKY